MSTSAPRPAVPKDVRQYFDWLEARVEEGALQGDQLLTRVGAAQQQGAALGNLASNANLVAGEASAAVDKAESVNRVARPLTDVAFWGSVIDGSRNLYADWINSSSPAAIETYGLGSLHSQAGNATPTPLGVALAPTSDEGAYIDVTAALGRTQNSRLFLRLQADGGSASSVQFRVTPWYVNGPNYDEDIVSPGGTVELPTGATAYSVRVELESNTGGGAYLQVAEVFEVIGSSGLNISPEGVSVEDGSGDKSLEINPSLPALDAPADPILSSSVGSVSVRWDGSLTTGPAPAHLSYVFAEEATTAAGPWTRVGQPLNRAGDIITRPPVGEERWYRFTAVDTSNRPSPTSGATSVVVVGVDIPDLTGNIGDVIDTVDGLNKIFFQPIDAPPAAHANGDLWFVVDAGTSVVTGVQSWNGTDWVPYRLVADSILVPGSVGTITLEDGGITAVKLAVTEIWGDEAWLNVLRAGVIEASMVTAGFGQDLNLAANGAIVLALGNAANAQAVAALNASRASEISSRVGFAQEQATAAAENAAQAVEATESLGRRFSFTEDGLRIQQPGGSAALEMAETGIAFLQNDVPVSLWDGGQMIVSRFVGEEVVLANHKIETRGARTIVRSM